MSPAGAAFPIIHPTHLTAAAAFSMCVYVDDMDATTAGLAGAGAPVLRPPADESWGERLADVADPDGTPVMLVAPLG